MAPPITLTLKYSGEGDVNFDIHIPQIFNASQVNPARYFSALGRKGIKIQMSNQAQLEKYLKPAVLKKLERVHFSPYEDAALLNRRSLFIPYIHHSHWTGMNKGDMDNVKHWLEDRNEVEVDSVFVPADPARWMKLRLKKTEHADKILKNGMFFRYTSIPSGDIKRSDNFEVSQCLRCYDLTHTTRKCRKPRNIQTCSKCGEEGHLFRTCTNDPHCLNCQGDHSAFSLKCEHKKAAMAKQRKTRSQSRTRSESAQRQQGQGTKSVTQTLSFAQAAGKSTKAKQAKKPVRINSDHEPQAGPSHAPDPPPIQRPAPQQVYTHPSPPPSDTATRQAMERIYACAAYAAFRPPPDLFNQVLVANGFAPINIPEATPGAQATTTTTPPTTSLLLETFFVPSSNQPSTPSPSLPVPPNPPPSYHVPSPTHPPPPDTPIPTPTRPLPPATPIQTPPPISQSTPILPPKPQTPNPNPPPPSTPPQSQSTQSSESLPTPDHTRPSEYKSPDRDSVTTVEPQSPISLGNSFSSDPEAMESGELSTLEVEPTPPRQVQTRGHSAKISVTRERETPKGKTPLNKHSAAKPKNKSKP